ncbi:MAG TPA: pyroglutamyl-peptidase I [Terriglobia bacterium]|nr:pyroglutamyl-peptidase I [Terriglobia bacterium]
MMVKKDDKRGTSKKSLSAKRRKPALKKRRTDAAREDVVLVTAFEPFGGEHVNASALAARPLDGRVIAGRRVVVEILPCVFGDAVAALRRALLRSRPALVVACGEAGGRAQVTVERVAINIDDASIADNAGVCPIDRAVVRGGPAAYWSTLPIKSIVAALREKGIPAAVSQTAGTFVCNHLFYALMRLATRRRGLRAGFIHLPYSEQQARDGVPTLATQTATTALEIAIATALTTRRDARLTGGAHA